MKLEIYDLKYTQEILKGKGMVTCSNWTKAKLIMQFLRIIYDATLPICDSSKLSSNMYMLEIFKIGKNIFNMCYSNDIWLKEMVKKI